MSWAVTLNGVDITARVNRAEVTFAAGSLCGEITVDLADRTPLSGLILPHKGIVPTIDASCLIAPNATVIGDVVIGEGTSVWFGCVIRGDVHEIRIGARTNIQDGTIVHVTGGKLGTYIGSDITIGHGADSASPKKASASGMARSASASSASGTVSTASRSGPAAAPRHTCLPGAGRPWPRYRRRHGAARPAAPRPARLP